MPASFRKIPGVTLFSHHTRVLIWFQFFVRYFLSFIREANLCKTSDDAASTPAVQPPPAPATHHTLRSRHPHPNRATPTRTSTTPHTEDGDSRQTRPLRPIVVGHSTAGGNGDRRKRRQAETTTDGNGGSPTASPARRPPAHRGQRPEQPWNERIGGSLWSFSLSKARTALERTLEPDVQNRRAVGRAHGLRNRQILAVAIPDALPGKQEGVGRKQVVDHV